MKLLIRSNLMMIGLKSSDDWHLPVYEVTEIEPNSTIIELTRLRIKLDDAKIIGLMKYLGGTYSQYLKIS